MVRGVRTCLAFACWTAHSGDSVLDVDPASKIQASCRRLLAMHISNHEPLRTHTHAVRHGHKQARGTHTHTHTYTSFTRSSLHPGSDAALARYRVLPTRCKFGVILCISLACCQPPLDSAGMHSILFLSVAFPLTQRCPDHIFIRPWPLPSTVDPTTKRSDCFFYFELLDPTLRPDSLQPTASRSTRSTQLNDNLDISQIHRNYIVILAPAHMRPRLCCSNRPS